MGETVARSSTEAQLTSTSGTGPATRGWLREAVWLAGKDIRASWLSFPAASLIAVFFGLLAVVQFDNALTGDNGAFGAGMLDFYLLCITSAFGTNLIFNRDYYASMRMDGFDERLTFLRSLPVGARSMVAGRVACAVLATVFTAPVFFAVPYLFQGGLRDTLGVGGYAAFCCFWVSYSLVITGAWYVYGSFAVRWRTFSIWRFVVIYLLVSVVVPVVFALLFGSSISMTLMEIAGEHGLPLAFASLLIGVVAVVVSVRKAEVGVARRDIG